MIKAIEFFRRRAGMPAADFLAHWQHQHTQVVLGVPGLRRYVQNPVVSVPGLAATGFDGVVEVWFDDLEVMRVNSRSDYWNLVVEDEDRFIDRKSVGLVLAEDPAPQPFAPGFRLIALLGRAPGVELPDFRAIVGEAMASARTIPGVTGTVCDFPIPSSYERGRTVFADAVAGLRFSEASQLERALAKGTCPAFSASLGDVAADEIRWLAVRERPILT